MKSPISILIATSFLSITLLIPLKAQVDTEELERLNFKLGGGFSVPTNPIAKYFSLNGNFIVGAGAKLSKHNSVEGEFMWSGLTPGSALTHLNNGLTGNVNVYSLVGNYRFHIDSIADSPFGFYVIGGGGWYYRDISIEKNYSVPAFTPCQPIYTWWGFGCDGYVSSTIASHGSNAGGINGGVGFTIRVEDTAWKFFVETRYHYVWSNSIPTSFVPLTIGFQYN